METPRFQSKDEEIRFWKSKWHDLEAEYEDFRESSSALEKELEKEVDQAKQAVTDLRKKCNMLTFNLDDYKEKMSLLSKENQKLLQDLSRQRESEEKLVAYVQGLEQENDDLKVAQRNTMHTLDDIQERLDSQIEKNALLETELDEKEALHTTVQRLKDEQRDMQQELQRVLRQRIPDNDRMRTLTIDSNKLSDEQTSMNGSLGQLSSPTARMNALNIVGDLLRKVGSLESKLSASRIPREDPDVRHRESYRSRSQRLNRPTSTGPPSSSIHGVIKQL